MAGTQEITDPRIADPDESDDDGLAHYVRKEDIVRSNVEGVPVRALCGKTWIPNRLPDGLPICDTCRKILERSRKAGAN